VSPPLAIAGARLSALHLRRFPAPAALSEGAKRGTRTISQLLAGGS